MLTVGLILYLLLVIAGAAVFFGLKNVWGIIAPMIALGFMAVASLTGAHVVMWIGLSIGYHTMSYKVFDK